MTYQDFINSDKTLIEAVSEVIASHRGSDDYKTASTAEAYYQNRNETIATYEKTLFTITGKKVKDLWSPSYKMSSGFFKRFVRQEVQHLLANGVSWSDTKIAEKLGTRKKPFDNQLKKLTKKAIIGGVAFGFWNLDHLEVFDLTEFAPLYDEQTGELMAGVRFYRISDDKPLYATLYEADGYTDIVYNDKQGDYIKVKSSYKKQIAYTAVDDAEVVSESNYSRLPIIPLYGNDEKQSALVGLREQIDCYDLIKNGFASSIDEASFILWAIEGAGGMDDSDLAEFVERMKTIHAAQVGGGDGAKATPTQIEAPYGGRVELLKLLRADLYEDAQALDTKSIAGGAITATQIKAAYEDLTSKCDDLEYNILDFIYEILEIAEIEADAPTFTRSMIVNTAEMVQVLLQSAQYLPQDYVTKKLLEYLGDGDKAEDVIKQMETDELSRMSDLI